MVGFGRKVKENQVPRVRVNCCYPQEAVLEVVDLIQAAERNQLAADLAESPLRA